MGDRYELDVKCAYCGKINFDIWYAPTCGALTFICSNCKKTNFITDNFVTKKIEKVEYDDVYNALVFTSNMLSDDQLKKIAKEMYEKLKNGRKHRKRI